MGSSKPIIAYQGEPGAFSHLACLRRFGPNTNTLSCPSFRSVFEALRLKSATLGMIPIENSIAGSIHENYDLMSEYRYQVLGEVSLRVEHNLLGVAGSSLKTISTVYSHPKALEQCAKFFLDHPQITQIAHKDTAGSAKLVAANQNPAEAAIASTSAAQIYGLKILVKNIETNPQNFTRFWIISPNKQRHSAGNKISLILTLPHTPGSLHKALSPISRHNLNLTKIESRPIPGKPWHYLFYLDIQKTSRQSFFPALDALKKVTSSLITLGQYEAST